MKRRLIYAALGLFIVLATLIVLVFGTTPGAHWLLRQAQQALPGELTVGAVRGSLLAGLALETPRYRDDMVEIGAERLRLRWDALALLGGNIRLDRVQVDQLSIVHIDGGPAAPNDDTAIVADMTAVDLPLPIELPRVDVDGLHVVIGNHGRRLDQLRARLRADRAGLDLHALSATAGAATFDAEGRLDWIDGLAWRLALRANAIDPAAWFAGPTGRIDAELRTEGRHGPDRKPAGMLDLARIEGELHGHALSAGGRIAFDGGHWSFADVQARVGDNRLRLDGDIDVRYALRASIEAPALDGLWPGLGGELRGKLDLDGERTAPMLRIALDGAALAWGDARIEQLRLRSDVDATRRARLTLRLDHARLRGIELERVTMEGDGALEAHRLALSASSAEAGLALDAAFDGGWRTDAWQGRLHAMHLRTAEAGDWGLARAAPLMLSADAARLEAACLARERASLCIDAQWRAGHGGHLDARLQDLPLALFDEPIRARVPALRLRGTVQGALRLDGDGRQWRGKSRLTVGRGALHYTADELRSLRLPFESADLEASLDDGHWRTEARIALRDGGHLRANLAGAPEADGPARLEGGLTLDMSDFEWLTRFNRHLAEPRGRLRADYRIHGHADAPALVGELRLERGRVAIPDLGLLIEDIEVTLGQPAFDEARLTGSLRSGAGTLQLAGEAALKDYGWHAALRVEGERFQVAGLPQAHALIDPLLAISLIGQDVTLAGRLHVPEARVELRVPTQQAVRVSADEVLVGVAPADKPRWNIQTRLEASFGEQVHIHGHGLSGRLAGALLLSDGPEGIALGDGELRVVDGRFQAYGQNLTVERGRLLFHGPVDNPGLDIRAARTTVDGVKAGIEIAGTLRHPRSRAYSEPALPESEAMAWLLTGRPLSGASGEEVLVMQQAAVLFGMERGSMLVSELAAPLGFEEATIDTSRGLDQSALLLGRYLTPRLYLRYTLGLAEGESALLLRYRLSKSWNLEAQTGTSQSLDLLYRIER